MGKLGHAQILGFSGDVQKALDKERAALRRMGVDVDAVLGPIELLHEQTVTLNAH